MRICRYATDKGAKYGIIEGDDVFEIDGAFPGDGSLPKKGKRVGSLSSTSLLAPLAPGKIICVGKNYAAHAAERGEEVPKEPLLFFKPITAIIAPGAAIERLPEMGHVDHEAELAVVIGKGGRFIPREEALEHVLGYTCADDVSERDYQAKDGQWTRAKGFDTFLPLGPWIESDIDASAVAVMCRVNGVEKQHGNTADMVFNVPHLIAHISRIMTLKPGDLILTGTPDGVSPIQPGDTVEVEVQGIGKLANPVTLRQA